MLYSQHLCLGAKFYFRDKIWTWLICVGCVETHPILVYSVLNLIVIRICYIWAEQIEGQFVPTFFETSNCLREFVCASRKRISSGWNYNWKKFAVLGAFTIIVSEMIRLFNMDSRFLKDKGIQDPLPTCGPYCANSCLISYTTTR
jgi:hypothetical protein